MGLGNAFAGAAATAEDANTVWFNPAGLARLNFPQVEAGIHIITPSAKLNNQNSQAAALQPLGGTGGDAGGTAFVPTMFASMAINDEWHIGIGINAPFGLKTDYDTGWLGRYQALKSEIKTININPAVGWRATKDFWVGAGVSYQQFKATLTNNTNYSGALAQGYGQAAAAGQIPASAVPPLAAATAGLDSYVSTTGDDWGWGWNVGAMYSFNGDANNDPGAGRIGLAYRSKIKYNVAGNVGISNPTPPTLTGALAPFNPVVQQVSATLNQDPALQRGRRARRDDAGHGVALLLPEAGREVGHPGRRHVDRLEQHSGAADPAYVRPGDGRPYRAAGEFQGHLAVSRWAPITTTRKRSCSGPASRSTRRPSTAPTSARGCPTATARGSR